MPGRVTDLIHRHGDAILAVGLVALMIVQVWSLDVSRPDKLATTAGALALLVPLARRVRVPITLMAVLAAVGLLGQWLPKRVLDVEAFGLIVLLVVYNGAAHTSGRRAWSAGAMTTAFGLTVLVTDPDGVTFGGVIFFTLLFGAPWLAGYVVQRRRVSEARMRWERDAAEAAIVDERARIARELHDVVAHAISVIVLQARGGRRLLDSEPGETRGALDTIEHTGQQALVEMRRLVGLLRESDEELALAPQPSLSRLDALVDQVRVAGLPVELVVEGTPVDLPPGVDLSAYRIVQEALTNALKHAGPARARVILRYEQDRLEVDVADDGAGTTNGDAGGHGLVGIRERVSVYGGELEAGPRAGGGYAVCARLPYASKR
ncbi:sensor histidine kinase [Gaiella occulta]|uniref:sensor histidine kinase n=1 Tax=Gaiella occulta TaxID=1002870 RepID=UPI001C68F484|nr:sensor histidine kinase [Gaiella occulta]